MGSPDSTAPAEAGAVPYITGRLVPDASPGTDLAEPDVSEVEGDPQAPGRVWPFLFKPRWIAWHLFVGLAVFGMLWLGDWQYHRAMGGNGLSWAYTFEWPLFAGFGIVFWARTIRDESRLRRGVDMATGQIGGVAESGPVLPDGVGTRPIERPADDADDAELASYNAYLAKLNAEVKGHNKWRR